VIQFTVNWPIQREPGLERALCDAFGLREALVLTSGSSDNAYALTRLGPLLEERLGSARFIVLFLVTGVGGSAASALWNFTSPVLSAGASGALCGLLGAGIVVGRREGGISGKAMGRFMIEWSVWVLVFGIFVGADNVAHIGGGVAGALFALLAVGPAGAPKKGYAAGWQWAATAAVACVAVAFAAQRLLAMPWPWPS